MTIRIALLMIILGVGHGQTLATPVWSMTDCSLRHSALGEAVALRHSGNLDAAASHMRRLRDACPDFVDARLELAVTLSWDGKLAEAVVEYDSVLEMQPANQTALLGRARVLSWKGETESAREIYRGILLGDIDHLGALNGLALTYRIDGRYRRARETYRHVLYMDPSNAEATEGLTALRRSVSLEGTMTVGEVTLQDGRQEVGNFGGLVWRPSGLMTYSGSVSTANPDGGLPSRTTWTVGVDRKLSKRVSLGLAYEQVLVKGHGRSGVQVSSSIRTRKSTSLQVMLKPTHSTGAATDLLLSLGVVQSVGSRSYFIMQVFDFRSSSGYRSRAYSASGRISLSKRIEARPAFSISMDAWRHRLDVGVGVGAQLTSHLQIGVQTGVGSANRKPARFGVSVNYRR